MVTNAFAAGAYASAQNAAAMSPVKKASATSEARPSGGGFESMVQTAVDSTAQAGQKADAQALKALGGKADIVDLVTAVAEAEASMEVLIGVRDRVIAAYQEMMNMPV